MNDKSKQNLPAFAAAIEKARGHQGPPEKSVSFDGLTVAALTPIPSRPDDPAWCLSQTRALCPAGFAVVPVEPTLPTDHPLKIPAPKEPPSAGQEAVAKRQREIMEHDYPVYLEFWRKHALGSKLAPSCFTCGCLWLGKGSVAVSHAELPDIFVCKTCKDKIDAHPPTPPAVDGDVVRDSSRWRKFMAMPDSRAFCMAHDKTEWADKLDEKPKC